MGKAGLLQAKELLLPGGTLLHNFERRQQAFPDLENEAKEEWTTLMYIPTREILHDLHLHHMFENALLIGAFARALGIPFETIEQACFEKRGKKEHLRDNNLLCLKSWYSYQGIPTVTLPESTPTTQKKILIDGNTALALWAIHAGVRCYYAYPMSPSSSILTYFADSAQQTWIVVKQAEDEITAIQMCLGSMYAWARALTATSWGWFDLMTETISLSGMTEVPLVCIIAQRPWPATWLPTRTAQADLQLAIHAGHGEFARIVIAISDQESGFHLIQEAFDLAEQFQVPVMVLTEKVIAENYRTVPVFHKQRQISTDDLLLIQISWKPSPEVKDIWLQKAEYHLDGFHEQAQLPIFVMVMNTTLMEHSMNLNELTLWLWKELRKLTLFVLYFLILFCMDRNKQISRLYDEDIQKILCSIFLKQIRYEKQ
jgi:hypothetical protein